MVALKQTSDMKLVNIVAAEAAFMLSIFFEKFSVFIMTVFDFNFKDYF